MIPILLGLLGGAVLAIALGWLKLAAGLAIIGIGVLVFWGEGETNDESGMRTPEQAKAERLAREAMDREISAIRERGAPWTV